MRGKQLIQSLFTEPRRMQLEYAEECLQGQHTSIESTLAAVNMGLYPVQPKEKILENVQKEREQIKEAA